MGSFLLSGAPGSGKTTLACSFINLGYKVYLIDADRKAKTMHNLKEWIDTGRLDIIEVSPILSGSTLGQVARKGLKFVPTAQPAGYLEIVDIIDGVEKSPPEDAGSSVLVLDSTTRVDEHMKRLMKHFSGKPKLEFDGWDAVLNNYEELFSTFYGMQPDTFAHCVITTHTRDVYDTNGAVVAYKPLIGGQFSEKASGYVEEHYHCDVDTPNKNSKPRFMVYTKPTGLIKHARSSRPLKTYVEADMSILLSDLALEGEEEEE